jgi:hypothetical protein
VLEAGEKSRAEGHVILLQAHMSSLRYHPLLAAFFGINAATISPLAGSELQGVRFTLRASAREREREKEKEKKSTQQRTHSVPGDGRAPFGECGRLCSLHFIAGC